MIIPAISNECSSASTRVRVRVRASGSGWPHTVSPANTQYIATAREREVRVELEADSGIKAKRQDRNQEEPLNKINFMRREIHRTLFKEYYRCSCTLSMTV